MKKILDENEAPEGYVAVLKEDAYLYGRTKERKDENYCNYCDWRKQCQDPNISKAIHNHRCMSYTVIVEATGEIVTRNDGCSVIFRKRDCDNVL